MYFLVTLRVFANICCNSISASALGSSQEALRLSSALQRCDGFGSDDFGQFKKTLDFVIREVKKCRIGEEKSEPLATSTTTTSQNSVSSSPSAVDLINTVAKTTGFPNGRFDLSLLPYIPLGTCYSFK